MTFSTYFTPNSSNTWWEGGGRREGERGEGKEGGEWEGEREGEGGREERGREGGREREGAKGLKKEVMAGDVNISVYCTRPHPFCGSGHTHLSTVSIFLTAQHEVGQDEDWRGRLPV